MTPAVAAALAEGDLAAALALQARVPASAESQLLHAELLFLAGRLDEAGEVFGAIESDDPAWPASRRAFLRLIRAETMRLSLRRTQLGAEFEPPHFRHRVAALRQFPLGDAERAVRHIDKADALMPELVGHADGVEFEGWRDGDDCLGSVGEFFARGRYLLIPWDAVRTLALEPAAGPLDAAYRPGELTLSGGERLSVTVPLTYPRSAEWGGEFALALETDWGTSDGPGRSAPLYGIGAKVMHCGGEELVLGSVRRLDLRPTSGPGGAGGAGPIRLH